MQKIAAYVLERRHGMQWPEARAAETEKIQQAINKWLSLKGAKDPSTSGSYDAEDGSKATYFIEEARVGDRSWWMVKLEEVTTAGRRFISAVSVTNTGDRVVVYASLEAGSDATAVVRIDADPRCPRIVRTLLESPDPWFHGGSQLRTLREFQGFDAGEALVAELKAPERTVPVIVLSVGDDGEVALPGLQKALAYDVVGIANVAMVDTDASWALTDGLGKGLTCFGGAVRVYWPRLSIRDDPFRHPLWTRQRLVGVGGELVERLERFRRQLRTLVMHAAALGVVRPREIDAIRGAASSQAFAEMKAKAVSLQDFEALAGSYADENTKLRAASDEFHNQLEQLQSRVADLQAERAVLLLRVENAEVQLRYREDSADEIPPDTAPEVEGPTAPEPDEVRYYKKVHSTPSHDLMVLVGDCGCNSWQASHAADKARKGIARLEGREDWNKMQHCGSCTGGGVWRVKW